ncbi:PREDICTED: serine/threonine-protein phosphatase 7 long form homolog [Ipomoea nil]|uniref:serine/threonine-protein phosphatase 7 long form homolog n=1 Tax=Ipomoea nil TaxID=35883 RepID=UPI000901B60E|nr:PREDICTED: serine/threonine-protein phosphatase 7 long form homolog [Ipomoea nil]
MAQLEPGPICNSVLNRQQLHRSTRVWEGSRRINKSLKCCRYDSSFWSAKNEFDDRVMTYIQLAGFDGLSRLERIHLDWSLITAMVERWRPETHCFQLPFGEVTITLQDVEILLGLRIDGMPVTTVQMRTKDEWSDICHDLLGIRPNSNSISGSSRLVMTCLKNPTPLTEHSTDEDVQRMARLHIMQLLGGTLFPDKSNNMVRLCFLDHIRDLRSANNYSWGSAVLAFLYRSMCRAAMGNANQISGALILLQLWVWERITLFSPNIHSLPQDLIDRPRAARWCTSKEFGDVASHVLKVYRDQIDNMKEDSHFKWRPYENELDELPDYCKAGKHVWMTKSPLIMYEIVEWHLPDRVLRQFGKFKQPPPANFDTGVDLHKIDGRGKRGTDWSTRHMKYLFEWESREENVVNAVADDDNDQTWLEEYERWYSLIARRVITNPVHRPERGFMPLASKLEHLVRVTHKISGMAREGLEKAGNAGEGYAAIEEACVKALTLIGEDRRVEIQPNDDIRPQDDDDNGGGAPPRRDARRERRREPGNDPRPRRGGRRKKVRVDEGGGAPQN